MTDRTVFIDSRQVIVEAGNMIPLSPVESSYRERLYQPSVRRLMSDKVVGLELFPVKRGWDGSIWHLQLVLGTVTPAGVRRAHEISLGDYSISLFPFGTEIVEKRRRLMEEEKFHRSPGVMLLTHYFQLGEVQAKFNFDDRPDMGLQVIITVGPKELKFYGAMPKNFLPHQYFYEKSSVDD